jgi:hypothetical protein
MKGINLVLGTVLFAPFGHSEVPRAAERSTSQIADPTPFHPQSAFIHTQEDFGTLARRLDRVADKIRTLEEEIRKLEREKARLEKEYQALLEESRPEASRKVGPRLKEK